ncbi:MAG: hypothetical protein FWJ34_07870, partial [Geminocystis sp. GBBB08]|nr:hypothetical protein [Geminocystis sp. GBBB08]
MFEEGVEPILDEFEGKLSQLSSEELSSALVMTSEKLLVFGRMANLEPFIQLCESIQQEAVISNDDQIHSLIQSALILWRRSHALVVRGSFDKLPSTLQGDELINLVDESFHSELQGDELINLIDESLYSDSLNFDFNHEDFSSLTDALDSAINLDFPLENNLAVEQSFDDFDLFSPENIDSKNLEELENIVSSLTDLPSKNSLIPAPPIPSTSPSLG